MRCRPVLVVFLLILFAGVVFYKYKYSSNGQKVEENQKMNVDYHRCGIEIDTERYDSYCDGWSCTVKQCFGVKSCFDYPSWYSKSFPVDEFADLVEGNKKFIEELFAPGSRFLNQTKIELLKQMEQYGFNVKVVKVNEILIRSAMPNGVEVFTKVCPN